MRKIIARAVVLMSIVLVAQMADSCSKSKDPTSPGGGGGGGPTFNFGPLAIGQSVAQTFTTAGGFPYFCSPHRNFGMTGTVNVATGGDDSALVQVAPGNALVFSPATVTIKPNAYVRWVNVSSSTMHTVTR